MLKHNRNFNHLKNFFYFIYHPITRKNKILFLYKFFLLNFKKFLFKKFIVNWIENLKFYYGRGMWGLSGEAYYGLNEMEDQIFLLHFLKKNDLFLDIGANLGSFALLASGIKGAKTIAVEPSSRSFLLLNENVKLNNLEHKIQLLKVAVGDKNTEIYLSKNLDVCNRIVNRNEYLFDSEKVSCITLDELLAKCETIPALIKLDIEGYEYRA